LATEGERNLSLWVVSKPAAPNLQHLTEHCYRPALLVLRNASVLPLDSRAKQRPVFFSHLALHAKTLVRFAQPQEFCVDT
jgi:hypothetical protein